MSERIELFRYSEKTGRWKKIRMERAEDGGLFFSAEEGEKGSENTTRITIKLNEQEIAYMALKLMKMI